MQYYLQQDYSRNTLKLKLTAPVIKIDSMISTMTLIINIHKVM